jgi:hypothetical protein
MFDFFRNLLGGFGSSKTNQIPPTIANPLPPVGPGLNYTPNPAAPSNQISPTLGTGIVGSAATNLGNKTYQPPVPTGPGINYTPVPNQVAPSLGVGIVGSTATNLGNPAYQPPLPVGPGINFTPLPSPVRPMVKYQSNSGGTVLGAEYTDPSQYSPFSRFGESFSSAPLTRATAETSGGAGLSYSSPLSSPLVTGVSGGGFQGMIPGWQGVPFNLPDADAPEEKARRRGESVVQTVAPTPKLDLPQYPTGPFDLNTYDQYISKANDFLTSGTITGDQQAEITQNINTAVQTRQAYLSSLRTVDSTIDSRALSEYLNGLSETEKSTAAGYIDNMKKSLGIPEIDSNVLKLLDSMSATNEVYNRMIKDIRDNPNLPRALADRRIKVLADEQKAQVTQMQSQLEQLNYLRDSAYKQLELGLNIYKADEDAKARNQANNRQLLQILADNGGLANLTEDQLVYWSQLTGVPVGSMRALSRAASTGDVKIVEGNDGAFYKQTIGRDGKVSMVRITDPIVSSAGSGLTMNQRINAEMTLGTRFDKATEGQRTITQQAGLMNDAYNRYTSGKQKDLNAVGQTIVTTFNKILDPGSVVRESEYARSAEGVSLIQRISGYGTRITEGGPGLTPTALKEFVTLANSFAQKALTSYNAELKKYRDYANQYGLNTTLLNSGVMSGAGDISSAFDDVLGSNFTISGFSN